MTTTAYTHRNRKGVTYYLLGKEVVLQNGRPQPLYYFARAPASPWSRRRDRRRDRLPIEIVNVPPLAEASGG